MNKIRCAVKVLPGEPTDGTGRVCIHLFVQDNSGPFVEPHALHPVIEDGAQAKQKLEAKATRGRLACDCKRLVAPVKWNGIITVTPRTDDPRAVTCPKCIMSADYLAAVTALGEQTLTAGE